MNQQEAQLHVEYLLAFAEKEQLLKPLDVIAARNALLDLLGLDSPYDGEVESLERAQDRQQHGGPKHASPVPILDKLLDYAVQQGLVADDTVTQRDLFDARIMGLLMPRPSEVEARFRRTTEEQSITAATDEFYRMSIASNYIRMDRIAKNKHWLAATDYGDLEITINLSKPEKDPRDIAAERSMPQTNYPSCLLCEDNVGFAGRMNHPARQNHRIIPLELRGEEWFLQYSPYVYYNEHSIIINRQHVPMRIRHESFARLLDFVEQFPHYFIGSNADLPIVGGSILNHDHFQAGHHQFPMEKAAVERQWNHPLYRSVTAGKVAWPMSVLRLNSTNKDELWKAACELLDAWREYSDSKVDVEAYTVSDGEQVPHNTITPIARMKPSGEYELDLVLRNNRTTSDAPFGLFHPRESLHHIKKENIGLIEVMGLAILPGRLLTEVEMITDILSGNMGWPEGVVAKSDVSSQTDVLKNAHDSDIAPEGREVNDEGSGLAERMVSNAIPEALHKHATWIDELVQQFGTKLPREQAAQTMQQQLGDKFLQVLLDAGVYKRDPVGQAAFDRFVTELGYE